jgi:hypothetical protein
MTQPLDATGFQHAVVDVHGNYRSKRLLHEPPDELISDVVTARVLRPHLVRSGFYFSVFMTLATFALLSWVIGVIAKAAGSFDRDSRELGDTMFGLTTFLLVLLCVLIVVWLISLFLPVREPIAEYGLLIEGRAERTRSRTGGSSKPPGPGRHRSAPRWRRFGRRRCSC